MRRLFKYQMIIAAVALSTALLTGCGGGGGSESGGGSVLTGDFVDGPVGGLSYSTATLSGTTGADGSFQYKDGEVVSFHVGDVLVGQAAGASSLSPFDLAGTAAPQTALEVRQAVNALDRSHRGTPFERAANIAVFLQTLDEDGNLINGIQIPDQMHTLASGVSIDFDQKWRNFPEDFSFRKLIADGRAAGLWGGSRAIRNPAYALDSLYEGLGITPEIYARRMSEDDYDADAMVDYRTTRTFDSNGNPTIYESDTDADGAVDQRYTYTFDANGNRTMEEYDTNADGTVDERQTDTYDANGNRTMEEYDSNADGTAESRTTYTNQLVNGWMYYYWD